MEKLYYININWEKGYEKGITINLEKTFQKEELVKNEKEDVIYDEYSEEDLWYTYEYGNFHMAGTKEEILTQLNVDNTLETLNSINEKFAKKENENDIHLKKINNETLSKLFDKLDNSKDNVLRYEDGKAVIFEDKQLTEALAIYNNIEQRKDEYKDNLKNEMIEIISDNHEHNYSWRKEDFVSLKQIVNEMKQDSRYEKLNANEKISLLNLEYEINRTGRWDKFDHYDDNKLIKEMENLCPGFTQELNDEIKAKDYGSHIRR